MLFLRIWFCNLLNTTDTIESTTSRYKWYPEMARDGGKTQGGSYTGPGVITNAIGQGVMRAAVLPCTVEVRGERARLKLHGAQPPLKKRKNSCDSVRRFSSFELLALPIFALPVLVIAMLMHSDCLRECLPA